MAKSRTKPPKPGPKQPKTRTYLPKSPTGIQGLDEITGGGLAKGRSTLICGGALELTNVAISSLIDSWLLLCDVEIGGEHNRALYLLKSRGMAHSNQIREFLLTDHGVELCDV